MATSDITFYTSQEQVASRMAAVERQKLAYQKIHADTLVKAEEAERVRREKIAQEIQALKNSVKATHSERDKAHAVIKAKEARWHEVNHQYSECGSLLLLSTNLTTGTLSWYFISIGSHGCHQGSK